MARAALPDSLVYTWVNPGLVTMTIDHPTTITNPNGAPAPQIEYGYTVQCILQLAQD